ncbi:MAG TPA: STAS domain-containing protein [Hydrogenophaga sp.]
MAHTDSSGVVSLPERLTLQEAVTALERLGRALKQLPGPTVNLNASALKVFDSSAVAVLLELRRSLLAQGKTLTVQERPKRLDDLVGLYGVAELLPN